MNGAAGRSNDVDHTPKGPSRLSEPPMSNPNEADDRPQHAAGGIPTSTAAPFVEFPREALNGSITDRFDEQVESQPDRIAVRATSGQWTYRELQATTNRVARAVLTTIGPASTGVALLCDHDAPMIAAVLGVLKAGKAYVPIDLSFPAARMAFLLEDSQASALVTDERNRTLAQELSGGKVPVITVGDKAAGEETDIPAVAPDDLAYILHTSGSTGQPKGVMQSHRNALHHIRVYTNRLRIGPADRLTSLAPYGFDAAVQDVFGALLNGATLCLFNVREQSLDFLASWLVEEGITIYHSTPTVYRYLMHDLDGHQLDGIRLVVLGGEKVVPADIELYKRHFSPDCFFINGLGLTESTVTLQYVIDKEVEVTQPSVPVGYPVDDTEILLLDECGEEVARNEVGELVIRSPYVALGYWRRPELTAAAFQTDSVRHDRRIYRTGDLARRRSDEAIEFVGRKDLQTKIRGHRIEVAEVEHHLLASPDIAEAVVVAREVTEDERQLVAYVVPKKGRTTSATELHQLLRARLPEYMIPAAFVTLTAMPLTPNGKVDRGALPSPQRDPKRPPHTFVPPRTSVEIRLAQIWEELLGVGPVGIRDDFFELGGHSLLAVRLFAEIETAIGKRLPLSTLLQRTTIERLAEAVAQQQPVWPSLVPLQVGVGATTRPAFFCVHPIDGDAYVFASLAEAMGPDQPFYSFRAQGMDGVQDPQSTIEAMAARYIEEMRPVQDSGPYYLGGYSAGATVAYEMACQLQTAGEEVAFLGIIDEPAPKSDYYEQQSGPLALTKHHISKFFVVHFLGIFVGAIRAVVRGLKLRNVTRYPLIEDLSALSSRRRGELFEAFEELRKVSARNASPDIEKIVDGLSWLLVRDASELPDQQRRVITTFCQALVRYTPPTYPGQITLLRAEGRVSADGHDRDMGWAKLAAGGVDVRVVPGGHFFVLQKRYAGGLAQELRSCLEKAQPGKLSPHEVGV
jgi:amino acid adenylation domain-containing protein